MKKRRLILPIVALFSLFGWKGSNQLNLNASKKTLLNSASPIVFSYTYEDFTDGYDTSGTSGTITKTVSSKTLNISYSGINTKSSENATEYSYGYAMFVKNKGFFYTTDTISGYYISDFSLTFSSTTGVSGKVGTTFGTTSITTRQSSVTGSVTKSGTHSAENTDKTKGYVNFSTTGNNVQVASFTITFAPITYTVSFNSNGGSDVASQTIDKNGTAVQPTAPTREHYTFAGWYTDNDTFENAYNFSTAVTSDITLYAKWTINKYLVIFYDENGNSYSDGAFDVEVDALTVIDSPTSPSKSGYVFMGWYEQNSDTAFDFSSPVTKDLELYATFVLDVSYTVTYVYNNGSANGSDTVYSGNTLSQPADPVKSSDSTYNYTFDAWCTDPELTVEYEFSTTVTADFSLYARYTATKISEDAVRSTNTKVKLNYNYVYKEGAETIDFTAQGFENQTEVNTVDGTDYNVTFAKKDGNNAPKYYTSGTAVRAYGGNTFTVTSEYYFKKVEITFGSSDGSNTITTKVGSYSDGTWTGITKSLTFTIGGTSGNRRIQSIKITPLNYTFSDVYLNYGAIVSQANYNDIFDGATDKKIGVVFARTSKLTANTPTLSDALTNNAAYIGKTEVDPATRSPYKTDATGAIDDAEGTYYSWSVTLAVPTLNKDSDYTEEFLTESITAAAYMYVDGKYVFFGERAMSVAQAAEAYKGHSVYTNGTDMTRATLDYLAALDD